jgi:hypothetical protein
VATEGPPVDFYAASLAAVAVVLFAKFVTHHVHRPAGNLCWKVLHWACVGAAWTGFVVSLLVLGSLPSGCFEVVLRLTVGFLVVFAATILAVDVGRLERGL